MAAATINPTTPVTNLNSGQSLSYNTAADTTAAMSGNSTGGSPTPAGGGVLSQGSAAASGTAPTVASLTPTAPTVGTFTAVNGTAGTVGTTALGTAANVGNVAGITGGTINPNDATNTASQLDAITASGSPYMDLAKNQGMLSAASRGLGNSSIASGASEAAAVAAAAPLAEQNASAATGAQMQNSQLDTQASEFNSGQVNANAQLNAQLQTQTSQFDASQQQTAGATNAAAVNAIKSQMLQIQGQLATQFLSGSQAQALAGIQGQYSELISQNQAAASLAQSTLQGMSAVLSNPNINATQASEAIQSEITFLNSSLGMMNTINGGSGSSGSVSDNSTSTNNTAPKKSPIPA